MAVPPINSDRDSSSAPHAALRPTKCADRRQVPWTAVLTTAAAALATLAVGAIVTAENDVRGDPRLGVPGGENLPVERAPFLGYTNWPSVFSLLFLAVAVGLLGYYAWISWRGRFLRHELVVFASLLGVSWLDPLGNWVVQASFDPRFLHFPTSWPGAKIAPGVEPIMVVVGYPFLFLTIALAARAIARRTPAAQRPGARGMVVVALIGFVTGVVLDCAAQAFMMNAHMYVYLSHIPPALTLGDATIPWLAGLYDGTGIAITTTLLWIADRRNAGRVPARLRHLSTAWIGLTAGLVAVVALGALLNAMGLNDRTFHGPWPFPEMIDGRPL